MQEQNGRFLFRAKTLDTASIQAMLAKAGFNPAEPRDYRGRWTRSRCQSTNPLRLEQIQYQGGFHDVVLDYLIENLKKSGAKAFKSIRVYGANGRYAIADGGALIPGRKPFLIDVKTGENPDFTDRQNEVYSLLFVAVSFDPKIRDLGFVPGQPLPPLDVMIARTLGPEKEIRPESYCKLYGFWKVHHGP